MPVSTDHKVTQYVEDFHVTGTVDSAGASELCSPDAKLMAKVISITRTAGGGIAYEFAIVADEKPALEAKKQAAADAAVKAEADRKAAAAKAADGQQKAQDAADARLAKVVSAAVAEALKLKA